jgi:hypothetical protein
MQLRPFHICGLLLALLATLPAAGQTAPSVGSLKFQGQFNSGTRAEKLNRKRFYLLRGGLEENKALIERIRAAEIVSRDCYYSRVQASPQLICWLQAGNCESPYCRKVEQAEVEGVPEFKDAYQKGLKTFGNKPNIALDWLASNLSPIITDGFYKEKESLLTKLLGDVKPVQSAMTGIRAVELNFVDIPVVVPQGKKGEPYTVSNILPIELGDKSYVWACQVDVFPDRPTTLSLPPIKTPRKTCVVEVKDLNVCKAGGCDQK